MSNKHQNENLLAKIRKIERELKKVRKNKKLPDYVIYSKEVELEQLLARVR